MLTLLFQVNHAVCPLRDKDGGHFAYSLGGYHADEDDRTVIQADTQGGPFFKSSPIDIHCLDYGWCTVFLVPCSIHSFPRFHSLTPMFPSIPLFPCCHSLILTFSFSHSHIFILSFPSLQRVKCGRSVKHILKRST